MANKVQQKVPYSAFEKLFKRYRLRTIDVCEAIDVTPTTLSTWKKQGKLPMRQMLRLIKLANTSQLDIVTATNITIESLTKG